MSEENISRMNFKQLRNEVQLLRDELARMKRSYEDILYNLDYDNFSTSLIKKADNMQTSIEQSAEAIILQAQAIEGNTSAIGELSVTAETIKLSVTEVKGGVDANSTAIKLNAESISAEVKSREDADKELSSSITQTADSIKFAVNASYSDPEETDGKPGANSDKNVMYYDEQENLYWYYDGRDWCSTGNANFGTVFEQTATGFSLKGNVSISGNLITGGDIKGLTISTADNLLGDGVRLNSDNNSLEVLYNKKVVGRWRYTEIPGGSAIYPVGGATLTITNASASGTWDFDNATVNGLKITFG